MLYTAWREAMSRKKDKKTMFVVKADGRRSSKSHGPTGMRVNLGLNLCSEKTIFIELGGNSHTSVHTKKGAAHFANFLREVADRIDQEWSHQLTGKAIGFAAGQKKPPEMENVMPRVDGKSFRCEECGANVFRRAKGSTMYVCNGCGAKYHGE
jgi:hypothetical protein